MHTLSRQIQEETENMKRPITSNGIESEKKKPSQKNLEPDVFTGELYKDIEELTPVLPKLF